MMQYGRAPESNSASWTERTNGKYYYYDDDYYYYYYYHYYY